MAAILFPRDGVDDGLPNPRGSTLVVTNVILVIISTLMVIARWATRLIFHRSVGPDDWTILAALPLAIIMTVLFHEEVKNGFGLHKKDVDSEHLQKALRYFYVNQILYKAVVGFTKTSLLLLYVRIFMGRRFRIAVWCTLAIVICIAVSTIAATIWQCTPVAKAWNSKLPGHCVFIGGIWYSSSSLNIFTDACIIVLPITQLPALKLPKGQKIGLVLLFSLGIFIIMTTVIRISTLGPSVTAKDVIFSQAENNLWLGIETNTSIIVTCVPPLRNLFTALLPRLFASNASSSSNGHSGTHGNIQTNRNTHGTRMGFGSQNGLYAARSQGGENPYHAADSDEQVMLDTYKGGITKKTDVAIIYNSVDGDTGDLPINGPQATVTDVN